MVKNALSMMVGGLFPIFRRGLEEKREKLGPGHCKSGISSDVRRRATTHASNDVIVSAAAPATAIAVNSRMPMCFFLHREFIAFEKHLESVQSVSFLAIVKLGWSMTTTLDANNFVFNFEC